MKPYVAKTREQIRRQIERQAIASVAVGAALGASAMWAVMGLGLISGLVCLGLWAAFTGIMAYGIVRD